MRQLHICMIVIVVLFLSSEFAFLCLGYLMCMHVLFAFTSFSYVLSIVYDALAINY